MPRGRKGPHSPEDAERGYRVGKWKDRPNYECLRCPHASLVEQDMVDHVGEFHPEAVAKVARSAVLGADGEPAEVAVPAAPLPEPEPEPEAGRDDGFAVESWYAMPNYCCRSCGFKTLDRNLITKHVTEHGR